MLGGSRRSHQRIVVDKALTASHHPNAVIRPMCPRCGQLGWKTGRISAHPIAYPQIPDSHPRLHAGLQNEVENRV